MIEYFTYKKVKKHRAEKQAREAEHQASRTPSVRVATPSDDERPKLSNTRSSSRSDHQAAPGEPVLDQADEIFLRSLLQDEGQSSRSNVPEVDWPSDDVTTLDARKDSERQKLRREKEEKKRKDKEESKKAKQNLKDAEKAKEKPGRISSMFNKKKTNEGLKPNDSAPISEDEAEKEKMDLNRVLDRLNLTAKNNKVVPLSEDSAQLLTKFTQIFKDLANGVPTAYDDLVTLITDRDGAINRGFEKLPTSLQKLVTQLPDKLTSSIAPEILAAAAKSQGMSINTDDGLKGAAQKMFVPQNIMELVTKPGALVGMLRAIVTALKTRWPAFIGVNVIWSVALMLLMFVLWYCYKRGREERLKLENGEGPPEEAGDRVEELPDDPQLPAPRPESARMAGSSRAGSRTEGREEIRRRPTGGAERSSRP